MYSTSEGQIKIGTNKLGNLALLIFNVLFDSSGHKSASDAANLEVEFERRFSQNVTFPDAQQMEDYGRYIIKLEGQQSTQVQSPEDSSEDLSEIKRLLERNPMKGLSEQEKQWLWSRRILCLSVPDSLPRLLEAVTWASRDHVSQVVTLSFPLLLSTIS